MGLSVGRGRFVYIMKPSKYNGSALLGVVTKLSAPADKTMCVSNGGVRKANARENIMFRRCTLFP